MVRYLSLSHHDYLPEGKVSKFFLTSKGFIGTALGILVYVLDNVLGIAPEPVSDNVVDIVTLGLLVFGMYGRWVANKPLSIKPQN